MLHPDKMPEAEVSLRLASFLIANKHAVGAVRVAIDGAQVKTGADEHFPITAFLESERWKREPGRVSWQATYTHDSHANELSIHSTPGLGDVVATLNDGRTLRVEVKKGPLGRHKGSKEYPLLREALGQLLTVPEVATTDLFAVAVPDSPKFRELTERWRAAPLVNRFGILLLTVGRDGSVRGYTLPAVTVLQE